MSSFWSNWIIILTVVTLVGTTWLLFANRKTTHNAEDGTTGHAYDGIQELDNPLPGWWFVMFVVTIVFGIGYLIAYPGMGNYPGVLGWTQENQWEREVAKADEKYGPIFAKFAAMPVEEVAKDEQAMKMGQRMFANNCAVCHGSDANGGYGFPNLTDNDWLYGGSPAQIKHSIVHGRKAAGMIAWEQALGGAKEVANTASYVLSLSGREVDADMAAAGEAKFKMFCVACHGVDGKGNQMMGAPNLTDNIWLYGGSLAAVKQSISKGRNGVMPAHAETLTENKIHLLTAYVYSLSQGK